MSDSSKSKIFKCDDYMLAQSQKLRTFYEEKEFYDVTLIAAVDNVRIEAHRLVLSASSDYFRTMFSSTLKETTSEEVKLENMDGATLKLLLDFIYSSLIELSTDTVESILRTAHLYDLKMLIPVCCDFMKEQLDVSNCLGIAYLADQLGCTTLFVKAFAFACKYYEKVCKEKEFFKLNKEQLKTLISSNDIRLESKDNMLNSLIAWVEHDKPNREKQLLCLLQVCHKEFSKPLSENLSLEKPVLETPSLLPIDCTKPKETQNLVLAYDANDQFTVQVYNRELNKWSYEFWPKPINKRSQYSAVVINNKLFIAGGINIGGINIGRFPEQYVEYLDLQTMKWAAIHKSCVGGTKTTVTKMGESLYLVGADGDVWLLVKHDIDGPDNWRRFHSLNFGSNPVKVATVKELLYVTPGGEANVKCYDRRYKIWTEISNNTDLVNFGIIGLEGYLYVVGGETSSKLKSKSVERYNPLKDSWTEVQPMNISRSHVNCATLNNRLIAYGGIDPSGKQLNIVEEYNPKTNTWETLAPTLPHKFKMLHSPLLTI